MKKQMKIRMKILLAILWINAMIFAIPVLISMKSDIAVISGFSLIAINLWIIGEIIVKYFKKNFLNEGSPKERPKVKPLQ